MWPVAGDFSVCTETAAELVSRPETNLSTVMPSENSIVENELLDEDFLDVGP